MKRLLLIFILSLFVYALDAHVHGVVNLDIAVEKNEILFMVEAPSESFLGFEYKAKTAKENRLLSNVKKLMSETPYKLFQDNKLKKCKVTAKKWEQKFSGKSHSSIYSESYLKCDFEIQGLTLIPRVFEQFPNVKVLHLQVMTNDKNISKKIKNDKYEINL